MASDRRSPSSRSIGNAADRLEHAINISASSCMEVIDNRTLKKRASTPRSPSRPGRGQAVERQRLARRSVAENAQRNCQALLRAQPQHPSPARSASAMACRAALSCVRKSAVRSAKSLRRQRPRRAGRRRPVRRPALAARRYRLAARRAGPAGPACARAHRAAASAAEGRRDGHLRRSARAPAPHSPGPPRAHKRACRVLGGAGEESQALALSPAFSKCSAVAPRKSLARAPVRAGQPRRHLGVAVRAACA